MKPNMYVEVTIDRGPFEGAIDCIDNISLGHRTIPLFHLARSADRRAELILDLLKSGASVTLLPTVEHLTQCGRPWFNNRNR